MSWVKLDDHFFMHPKVMVCGPAAAWLWVASIGYANANLTDGFVPTGALPMLAHASLAKANTLAAKLVGARLWEAAEGGFRIHDYDDWNAPAEEIRSHREHLSKIRSDAGKAGGRRSGESRAEAKAKQVASEATKQNRSPSPTPTPTPDPELPTEAPPVESPAAPSTAPRDRGPSIGDVRELFAAWQAAMESPRSALDGKRERMLRDAIARHGLEDCKRAVAGCALSDFHMNRPGGGNTRGKRFNSIDLIFRDADKTEGFIAAAAGRDAAPAAPAADLGAYRPPRPIDVELRRGAGPDLNGDLFTNLLGGTHG